MRPAECPLAGIPQISEFPTSLELGKLRRLPPPPIEFLKLRRLPPLEFTTPPKTSPTTPPRIPKTSPTLPPPPSNSWLRCPLACHQCPLALLRLATGLLIARGRNYPTSNTTLLSRKQYILGEGLWSGTVA